MSGGVMAVLDVVVMMEMGCGGGDGMRSAMWRRGRDQIQDHLIFPWCRTATASSSALDGTASRRHGSFGLHD